MPKCPTCETAMVERGSLNNWWCHSCGTVVNPAGMESVPAQARGFAAMRAALAEQRKWIAMLAGWAGSGVARFDFDAFQSTVEIMAEKLKAALSDTPDAKT